MLIEFSTLYRLFGSESQITSTDWIITHVNFSSVFPRTCGTSDYYQWTVSDGVSYILAHSIHCSICILGPYIRMYCNLNEKH